MARYRDELCLDLRSNNLEKHIDTYPVMYEWITGYIFLLLLYSTIFRKWFERRHAYASHLLYTVFLTKRIVTTKPVLTLSILQSWLDFTPGRTKRLLWVSPITLLSHYTVCLPVHSSTRTWWQFDMLGAVCQKSWCFWVFVGHCCDEVRFMKQNCIVWTKCA